MKDIGHGVGRWTIEDFHVRRTYSGLLEGNPRDESVKRTVLCDRYQYLPDWIVFENSNYINYINEEVDGLLKPFILTFTIVNFANEKQAVFVVLVDEVDNITDTIAKIIRDNHNFTQFNWEW